MLVVVVHPSQVGYKQIELQYSQDTVARLINRQQVYVLLAKDAHREAQRQKREAKEAICVPQSGAARSPTPTPLAATANNDASIA